ncbi:MAG: hypothetical protein OK441_02945 [Thaumarchaeota archaeon]|nr:hypothetical protein [Nitrososphaerota archaeon]
MSDVHVCPKCREHISESRYGRHLKRCGTSHKHVAQSLYVPTGTAQVESANRGITYGPHSRSYGKKPKWMRSLNLTLLAALMSGGGVLVILLVFVLL